MKKTLMIVTSLLLIFSLSGCCLLLAGLGGLAAYGLFKEYGAIMFFADFWYYWGQNIGSLIPTDPSGDNITDNGDGTYTATGEIQAEIDGNPIQGKFAQYRGPMTYSLTFSVNDDGNPVFQSCSVSGEIIISNIDENLAKFTKGEKIIFTDTTLDITTWMLSGGKAAVIQEGGKEVPVEIDKIADLMKKMGEIASKED